jgi:hypothetical protein
LSNPITQAQPPLEFIEPKFNPLVYKTTQLLQPTWVRWRAKIADVEVSNAGALVELYRQFQEGKIRFMMAFRHPSTNDPLCMNYLLSNYLGKVAKQQGVKLQRPIHAHFIYDRGIPLWAGKGVGWYYSQMGCTPIRRGRVDLVGLRSIRHLFALGRFPMAAAPEGATNGHNEIMSPIEPGIAQFGFWCIEDLLKAGRPLRYLQSSAQQVVILPIGLQYHYLSTPWEAIANLLTQLEADSGLPPYSEVDLKLEAENEGMISSLTDPTDPQQVILYKRLIRLGGHLLPMVEKFYAKFYHQDLTLSRQSVPPQPVLFAANQDLADRLQVLMNAALNVAEQHFAIAPKGTITDRCRRLEQAGWDWIYRDDLKNVENLSPVEKGLADRIAEEASLRLWHMRLVESFVSVTGQYVIAKPTGDRFAEILLIFWDMVARIKGEAPFPRPQLGTQGVKITIGQPISVSDRWETYQSSRRQAVAGLTQDLQAALESMIF